MPQQDTILSEGYFFHGTCGQYTDSIRAHGIHPGNPRSGLSYLATNPGKAWEYTSLCDQGHQGQGTGAIVVVDGRLLCKEALDMDPEDTAGFLEGGGISSNPDETNLLIEMLPVEVFASVIAQVCHEGPIPPEAIVAVASPGSDESWLDFCRRLEEFYPGPQLPDGRQSLAKIEEQANALL